MTVTEAPPAPVARTSVGKKFAVAASGIVGLGYLVAHMVGNLKVFLGPHDINEYGEGLRDLLHPFFPRTYVLWGLRAILITAVVVHIVCTVQLARQSRAARTTRYVKTANVQATYASRTMRWGGAAIFAFIIFHLADLTWGVHPDYVRGDIYHNLVNGFERWWAVALYLVAMVCVTMHVYHGTWSVSQTLGLRSAKNDSKIRALATTLAVVLFVGFMAVPVGVLIGVID